MSGHSKWATTQRQKSSVDAKRGIAFTKIANLITVAAREGGGDLNSNFKLRLAIDKAKEANMPKDNIERAIKRGTGEGSAGNNFEEVTYELMGPAGSAFLVEAVTDNRNRTVGEVKTVANKNGGQLAGPNSVAWMFDKYGYINIEEEEIKKINPDDLELALIDAGALDINKDGSWQIITKIDDLQTVLKKTKEFELDPKDFGLSYFPQNELKIESQEAKEKIERFYELLENIDDVSNVYTNAGW